MLGLRCKDIENLLSSVGTRDFRYGPVAAPVTASSERPVSIGQLVTTCHHINNSHSGDLCGGCAPACPGLVTPTVPFRDASAGSPLTLSPLLSVGRGIRS